MKGRGRSWHRSKAAVLQDPDRCLLADEPRISRIRPVNPRNPRLLCRVNRDKPDKIRPESICFQWIGYGIRRECTVSDSGPSKQEVKPKMSPMTVAELAEVWGGDDTSLEWADFFGGLGWSLTAGCGITGNPAVCGAAIVVGAINIFYF